MKKIINISFNNNNGGLSLDADLLGGLLEKAGYKVWYNSFPMNFRGLSKRRLNIAKNLSSQFLRTLTALAFLRIRPISATLHLEQIKSRQLFVSRRNIFIANLEWLMEESYALFDKIDLFVCKTKDAESFFKEKNLPILYTSFSTISPFNSAYKQVANTFVHIAGNSRAKGTIPLMKVWKKHPEWPELKIISRFTEHLDGLAADNITIISGYLPSDDLNVIQNQSEVHLCTSEAEGFGHYICEPLSCGAIVITVDGHPMNELVQPDRGILINVKSSEPICYTEKFIFDPVDLEKKIELVLSMPEVEKLKLKENARKYFLSNNLFFEKRMIEAINKTI
ncbi:MAG: glycosyltransferase [Cycloclasticus sp.]|nr:glycosyltransferase [Cycloclasticus sp.]